MKKKSNPKKERPGAQQKKRRGLGEEGGGVGSGEKPSPCGVNPSNMAAEPTRPHENRKLLAREGKCLPTEAVSRVRVAES